MTALEVIRWAVALLFAGVAVQSLRLWRRHQTRAAGWVAAAFTTLAAAVMLGRLLPDQAGGVVDALSVVVLLGVLGFPYLLYRFNDALRPERDRWRPAVTGLALVVLAITVVVAPGLDALQEARPAWHSAYVLLALGYWTSLGVLVAVRLWRAGSGQPTAARTRMRTLAAASLTLNVALVLAAATEDAARAALVTQAVAGASAVLFMVGFAPPAALRALWRRPEGRELREAEKGLMVANSGTEIALGLLPPLARLLGGDAAALYSVDGRLLGAQGEPPPAPERRTGVPLPAVGFVDDSLVLQFEHGSVVARTSPYTPLFGADEVELAEGLTVLIDLALGRVDLLDRERHTWAELERTNEELQTLLYGLSHDLRNPLLTMTGYIDLLGQGHGGELNDDGGMFVKRIARSARYMDSLIRDLLELSRVGRVHTETEEVDLTGLARQVAEDVQSRHPGVQVHATDVGQVLMSPVRARQLLTNLLENAARHGGRDDVQVTVRGAPGADASLTVSVADNGVGVPPEYHERLFGMFERMHGGYGGGTGIGLAICRRIMEQVGGTIRLADTEQGTDIRLFFPAEAVCGHAALETNA